MKQAMARLASIRDVTSQVGWESIGTYNIQHTTYPRTVPNCESCSFDIEMRSRCFIFEPTYIL